MTVGRKEGRGGEGRGGWNGFTMPGMGNPRADGHAGGACGREPAKASVT